MSGGEDISLCLLVLVVKQNVCVQWQHTVNALGVMITYVCCCHSLFRTRSIEQNDWKHSWPEGLGENF